MALVISDDRQLVRRGLALAKELVPQIGQVRVVIADDNVETRYLLAKLLSFEEWIDVVELAGDGREAVIRCIEEQPDVVLMDIFMPVMDGLAAAALVAEHCAQTRTIVTSVSGTQAHLKAAAAAGAAEYLVKPFTAEELIAAIRVAMTQQRTPTSRPGPDTSAELREVSDPGNPAALDEGSRPAGFRFWGGGGPDQVPNARVWNSIYVAGTRPATVSARIWNVVWMCRSRAAAAEQFRQAVVTWTAESPEPRSFELIRGLSRWPVASLVTERSALDVQIGEQCVGWTQVQFGRSTTTLIACWDRIVVKLYAEDVPSDELVRAADRVLAREHARI